MAKNRVFKYLTFGPGNNNSQTIKCPNKLSNFVIYYKSTLLDVSTARLYLDGTFVPDPIDPDDFVYITIADVSEAATSVFKSVTNNSFSYLRFLYDPDDDNISTEIYVTFF